MEKREKYILLLVSAILVVLIAATAVFINRPKQYTIPFDSIAVEGTPEVTDGNSNYASLEIPISDGTCTIALDATPSVDAGRLNLYLTSDAGNTVNIRALVYTISDGKADRCIGSSNLIRPGEYATFVKLTEEISSPCELKVKVLTYEPESNYSMGSASLGIQAR